MKKNLFTSFVALVAMVSQQLTFAQWCPTVGPPETATMNITGFSNKLIPGDEYQFVPECGAADCERTELKKYLYYWEFEQDGLKNYRLDATPAVGFLGTGPVTCNSRIGGIKHEIDPSPRELRSFEAPITDIAPQNLVANQEIYPVRNGLEIVDGRTRARFGDCFLMAVQLTNDSLCAEAYGSLEVFCQLLPPRGAVSDLPVEWVAGAGTRAADNRLTDIDIPRGSRQGFVFRTRVPDDVNIVGGTVRVEFRLTAGKDNYPCLPYRQSVTRDYLIVRALDPSHKIANKGAYLENETITYTVTFKNEGNTGVQTIEVMDRLDGRFFDSAPVMESVTIPGINPAIIIQPEGVPLPPERSGEPSARWKYYPNAKAFSVIIRLGGYQLRPNFTGSIAFKVKLRNNVLDNPEFQDDQRHCIPIENTAWTRFVEEDVWYEAETEAACVFRPADLGKCADPCRDEMQECCCGEWSWRQILVAVFVVLLFLWCLWRIYRQLSQLSQ